VKTTSVEVVDEDVAEESIDSGKKELPSSTVAQNQDDSLNGPNRRSSGIIKAMNRHRFAAALGVVILGTGCLFYFQSFETEVGQMSTWFVIPEILMPCLAENNVDMI